MECDSSVVIQVVQPNKAVGEGTSNIMALIRRIMNEDWNVNMTHTYREANQRADWLAHWSIENDLGYKEWHQIPSGISSLLLSDAMGITTPGAIFM